ncbi:MAG: glycosyltransferase family 2 protein [Calditrichaeota bacterium]|nr:glycosyltransferase family 2 protein [Calditrichota bacterium]
MSSISVILITFNEEENIKACLTSVQWADEIIVVDSSSRDRTVEIARQFTEKVIVTDWKGYSANKNLALGKATGQWVLWIDADERVTPELAQEIKNIIGTNTEKDGFEMARKAFFLGRWIKHCGWYPGYVLRLFRRQRAHFTDNKVHEGVVLKGSRGRLKGSLLHYTDNNLEHYLWKFNRYTSYAADELAEKQRSAGLLSILFRPLHAFVKMYVLKLGILDGVEGLMLCLLSAGYVAMKYAKLWELKRPSGG